MYVLYYYYTLCNFIRPGLAGVDLISNQHIYTHTSDNDPVVMVVVALTGMQPSPLPILLLPLQGRGLCTVLYYYIHRNELMTVQLPASVDPRASRCIRVYLYGIRIHILPSCMHPGLLKAAGAGEKKYRGRCFLLSELTCFVDPVIVSFRKRYV